MTHIPPMPIRTITFDWGDSLASNHGMPYAATQRRTFMRLAEDLRALGGTIPPRGWKWCLPNSSRSGCPRSIPRRIRQARNSTSPA